MSALCITVLDAWGQINQPDLYYIQEHTHIPYQPYLFIWILLNSQNDMAPDIDGLMMFAALESEKIFWILEIKGREKYGLPYNCRHVQSELQLFFFFLKIQVCQILSVNRHDATRIS